MALITAYTKDKMREIFDSVIWDGSILGDDLTFERLDESTGNLGTVRGPAGPAGPTGDASQNDLITSFDAIRPGVWYSMLPLFTNNDLLSQDYWAEHSPGSGYAPARYRVVGDTLELDGWVEYTGEDPISGTFFFTATWPLSLRPANYTATGHAYRWGRWPIQIGWVSGAPTWPEYFGLSGHIGSTQPDMVAGEWINFTGISVAIV